MTNLLPSEVEYAKTEANSESVDDAILFIQDSLDRFHIYQGHRARVCNARQAETELDNELQAKCLQNKCSNDTCTITADWKMKYLEERFRDSGLHHYGKGWLGRHEHVIHWDKYQPLI